MYDLLRDGSSSPLSSALSLSPSPPPELRLSYPSPSSSQRSSAKASPLPEPMSSTTPSGDDEGAPPRKRRKMEPKSRTTQYLNLLSQPLDDAVKPQLNTLLNVLHKKRKIVVVAGAGMSVAAGIPDFRSSTGLFKSLRTQHNLKSSGKDLFDASVYQDDSSTSTFHDMVRSLSQKTKSAQPTLFHHLLATLAHEGRLLRLYSQNVDGIDTSLPPLATNVPLGRKGPWPKTIQLHGGLDKMVCSKCHALSDFQAELFDGPIPPACPTCEETDAVRTQHAGKRSHGIGRLRPRMVLYNEHNPDGEAIGSVTRADLRARPDALIVAGTTLKVPGVKRIVREMCGVVRDRRDGVTIWLNNDPEPVGKEFENCWNLVVTGPCDEVARMAAMRKWDEEEIVMEVTEEEILKVKKESGLKEVAVVSPRKNKAFEQIQGQLTPSASPRLLSRTIADLPAQELDIEPATPAKIRVSGPAGKSRSLTNNLGVKGKVQKTAPKKRAAQAKKVPKVKDAVKITNSFTISKTDRRTMKDKLAPRSDTIVVKTLQGNDVGEQVEQLPMHPLSPLEARNNSLSSIKQARGSNFPNLKLGRDPALELPEVVLSMKDRMSGTISPKGSLPASLAKLVDVD